MDSLNRVNERIRFPLTEREYLALCELARRETRPVCMQAQHIVLMELRRKRLLPTSSTSANQKAVQT